MRKTIKIDIYLRALGSKIWVYECSTNRYRTCKAAKEAFCKTHGLDSGQVKTARDIRN